MNVNRPESLSPLFINQEVLPQHSSLLVKKVGVVAFSILSGTSTGALLAINYGLNICLFASMGGAGGLVIGLIALAILLKKDKPSAPLIQTRETVEEQTSADFIQKQESHLVEATQTLETILNTGEPKNLTDQQLNQFLHIVDHARLTVTRQKQFESLLSSLEKELGAEQAQQIWQVPGLMIPETQEPSYILSDDQIIYFVQKAKNYFHNQKCIQEMRLELSKEGVSPYTLNQVFSHPTLSEYLTGTKALNPEIKTKFLDMARAVQAQENFDHLAIEITQLANQDLILDESLIEKKFNIEEVLKPLSESEQQGRREKLQQIINRAYLNRELKQKGKMVTGSQQEAQLLSYWGYHLNKTAYQDKEQVYATLNQIVQEQLREDQIQGSLSVIRRALKTCALKARLKMVNLTEDGQIAKFQTALNFLEQQTNEMKIAVQDVQMTFPQSFNNHELSLARKMIEECFEILKESEINTMIARFFKAGPLKQKFNDTDVTESTFQEFLSRNQAKLDRQVLKQACQKIEKHPQIQKDLAFYNKWGRFMQKEMIQGYLDSNEVLGEGACWALCYKLLMIAQKNPDLTPEEFAQHVKITPIDRFRQGIHLVGQRQAKISMRTLPKDFLVKEGFNQDELAFSLDYDSQENGLDRQCSSISSKLNQSQGCLRFHLMMEGGASHAIAIRLDQNREKGWVFDPNLGFFAFEEAGLKFEDLQKRCMEFIKDLTEYSYPSTYQIQSFQMT